MFDSPSIEDMKVQPEIGQSEKVIFNTGAKVGDVVRGNVVIVATTERLLVREKRGRNVDDEYSAKVDIELPLESIETIRRTGVLSKSIEIVCGKDVYELPQLQNGSSDLIKAIVDQEKLEKTEWGEESKSKRGVKQLLGGSAGIIGVVIGVIFVLLGIAGIISIAGILLGIAFFIGGGVIAYGSWQLIEWAFNKEEEWKRVTNH